MQAFEQIGRSHPFTMRFGQFKNRQASEAGVHGLGLAAVGVALAGVRPLVGTCPEGVIPLDLHGFMEQDSHPIGQSVKAVFN